MKPEFLARALALLAGGLDFLSGLGLAFAPGLTLTLMHIPVPGMEAQAYVRFVGAFVAAVGFSYLWALLAPAARLRPVLAFTVVFRLFVGSFALVAVFTGRLPAAWLLITAADYGLVVAQLWLLSRLARVSTPE